MGKKRKNGSFTDRSPKRNKVKSPNNSNKKSNKKQKPIDFSLIQVPLSNRFNPLASDATTTSANTQTTQKTPKQRIGAIVVTDVNKNFQKIIDDLQIDCDIKLVSVGEKIFPRTAEDKKKILDKLKEEKINSFSHPDDINKIFKVVLSGLPQIDTTVIESELKDKYQLTPTKIVMFNSQFGNKMYLCHFDKSVVNMQSLNKIKVVHHHIVKWQPYKPQNDSPTQCYTCAMYGHGARSCHRFAVCFLCAGNHTTKSCDVIKKTDENPTYKCYNCSSIPSLPHDHKANDVNCPFRAKYLAAKEQARAKNKRNAATKQSTHTVNSTAQNHRFAHAPKPAPLTMSFADATAQQKTHSRANPSSQSSSNRHTSHETHTNENLWSFGEVSQILRSCIADLKQCKSKLEQLNVIASLLENACV